MRKRRQVCLVGLFSLLLSLQLCRDVVAYDEPDNFAGLKFGEDLTKQMEECPIDTFLENILKQNLRGRIDDNMMSRQYDYAKINQSKTRCYTITRARDRIFATLWNMGEIQREIFSITATLLDGKLVLISGEFATSNTLLLLSILNQRYGKPTTQLVQPWMSKSGVKTTSMQVVWKGKNVSITLDERGTQIDIGSINYETEAWLDYQRQLQAERIKKGASGL